MLWKLFRPLSGPLSWPPQRHPAKGLARLAQSRRRAGQRQPWRTSRPAPAEACGLKALSVFRLRAMRALQAGAPNDIAPC